jgi:hypothetical protein
VTAGTEVVLVILEVLVATVNVEEVVTEEETVVVVAVEVEVDVGDTGTGRFLFVDTAGHFPVFMLQLPWVLEDELTVQDAIRVISAYEACGVEPLDVEV